MTHGRLLAIALAAGLGLLVFVLVNNYILTRFYHVGAHFLDTGWFAYVAWRSDWLLHAPDSHPWGAVAYLRHHVSLWFFALSALSQLINVTHAEYMGLWMGGIYLAGYGVGVLVLREAFGAAGLGATQSLAAGAVMAAPFAFNGVASQSLLFPHPEILISVTLCACLFFLVKRAYWAAALTGVFAVTIRADAGFHLALFCSGYAVALMIPRLDGGGLRALAAWPRRLAGAVRQDAHIRAIIVLALAGFAYGVLAYGLQAALLPGGGQFRNIYMGDPPFQHVAGDRILARIAHVLFDKTYIAVGFAGCLAAYALTRRFVFLAGVLVSLPWLFINLIAVSAAASSFFGYYAFPFIVTLAWPLLFIAEEPSPRKRRRVAGVGVAAIALSFVLGLAYEHALPRLARGMLLGDSADAMALTRLTAPRIALALGMDKVAYDYAMVAIAGHHLPQNAGFYAPWATARGVETVVYFQSYLGTAPAIEAYALEQELSWRCSLAGTHVTVLTGNDDHVAVARSLGLACTRAPDAAA